MKDFLESCSLLWSVWWCFSFFLPVVKNNGEDKFIGLSPPAEGFQVGLHVPMQGGREVLEARLLEAWDSHGRGALSGVSYSSMLTVSGLAVWRSLLSVIFLYQPPSSHWKQWLLAVPHQCATVQVTNMQSNLRTRSFSLLALPAAFHWMVFFTCLLFLRWIGYLGAIQALFSKPNRSVQNPAKARPLLSKGTSWTEWLHSAIHLLFIKLPTNAWNTTEPSPSAYTQMIFLASQTQTMMSQLSSWIIFPAMLVQKGTEINFQKARAIKCG